MCKKIAMAQIEIKTGDIVGNVDRAIRDIRRAVSEGADFIVFPEMTVSGYNCGDLFEKAAFTKDCQKGINRVVDESLLHENLVIIIGCPRFADGCLYNSAFIITAGIVVDHYDKQLLANDYHHEDRKYFKAGTQNKITYLNGLRFGLIICEDGWVDNGYGRDIIRELNNEKVDIIFSLNFSYFTYNKKNIREQLFNAKYGAPIVYVNCVGVGDITKNFITYDGNSFYTNGLNKLTYIENGNFLEAFQVITYDKRELSPKNYVKKNGLAYMESDKFENIYNAILNSQKRIFDQCGMKVAQVHISGGIDSAIVGYFSVKSMGKENVVFITQPSKNNGKKTLANADYLAKALEVELQYDPIIEYVDLYKKLLRLKQLSESRLDSRTPTRTRVELLHVETTLKTCLVSSASEILVAWESISQLVI